MNSCLYLYNIFISGPYFPVFGLNTDIYGINLRIQSEHGKIRARKSSYLDTFHAVIPSIYDLCSGASFVFIKSTKKSQIHIFQVPSVSTLTNFLVRTYRNMAPVSISFHLIVLKFDGAICSRFSKNYKVPCHWRLYTRKLLH